MIYLAGSRLAYPCGLRYFGKLQVSTRLSESPQQISRSWYLDPLVAAQKSHIHRDLVERWGSRQIQGVILKTDLFEEANGDDHFVLDAAPDARLVAGADWSCATVQHANRRFRDRGLAPAVTDLRAPCFAPQSFDLIVSNSTLDHFSDRASLWQAVSELAKLVKPGGRLIITLDNPWNPLYWPLRYLSQRTGPFQLGHTASRGQVERALRESGLEIVARDYLIHNPRLLSTGLFYAVRRVLGKAGTPIVQTALGAFSVFRHLPSKVLTASFSAVCAERPPVR